MVREHHIDHRENAALWKIKAQNLEKQLQTEQNTVEQLTIVIGAIVSEHGGHIAIPQASINMMYKLTYVMENGLILIDAEQEIE